MAVPRADTISLPSVMGKVAGGAVILAALLFVGAHVAAQTPVDPAHLTGPDRTARLVAGAKREGELTLYSSAPIAVMTDVTNAFTKKYDVKVSLWRGGSEEVMQRAITESRGGRVAADVMETAGPNIEAVAREKLLQPVETPATTNLMPEAVAKNRPWIVSRLSVFTIAYNSNAVRKADAPKSYSDLADPKWKGKLGIEADDDNWLMAMSDALGGETGLKLFRDIVEKNGISVRKGHSLLANLVSSGEVPMALDSYLDEVAALKKSGAPIETVFAAPVIAMPTAVGIFKRAAHPYAATLFVDFLLSEEGQSILAAHNVVPTNTKVQHLPAGVKLVFMDAGKYLDENAKWTKMYKDIFVNRVH
ncbi:MAG TPA: extracellular solute-binding protein [Micropepsaceae bacterium]|nr:extracellular solute-binding protein [Micropepsaceae bacterium]